MVIKLTWFLLWIFRFGCSDSVVKRSSCTHICFFSAFIVWMKQELENFVKIFKRHVFDSKSNLATIAECISIATKHCNEVSF